jgi:hypothetical protein
MKCFAEDGDFQNARHGETGVGVDMEFVARFKVDQRDAYFGAARVDGRVNFVLQFFHRRKPFYVLRE